MNWILMKDDSLAQWGEAESTHIQPRKQNSEAKWPQKAVVDFASHKYDECPSKI